MLMNVLSKSFSWLFFSITDTRVPALPYFTGSISSGSLFFSLLNLESTTVSFLTLYTIELGDYHQLSIHILWRLFNSYIYLFICTNPSLSARTPGSGQLAMMITPAKTWERCSVSFSIRIDGILRGSEYLLIAPRNGMRKRVVHSGAQACSSASLCALSAVQHPLITSILCFSPFPRSPAQMKSFLYFSAEFWHTWEANLWSAVFTPTL